MSERILRVATVMLLVAVGAAGQAAASVPVPDGPDTRVARPTGLVWKEVTYQHGKVVRVRSGRGYPDIDEKGRSLASIDDRFSVEEPAPSDVTDPNDGAVYDADADYGSCKQVDVAEEGHTLFYMTAYRFHHTVFFCWRYPRITAYHPGVYLSDVDGSYEWRGVIGSEGYWYTWRDDPHGGHYSFRQGHFENCIAPWGPCLRDEYPWVKIWINGNGAWSADRGGGIWIG
jgi:hypothetical protein